MTAFTPQKGFMSLPDIPTAISGVLRRVYYLISARSQILPRQTRNFQSVRSPPDQRPPSKAIVAAASTPETAPMSMLFSS
jgi:hypothetical protein